MRAVVFGVLASVLALGSAQAKGCRLDGAELASDDGRTFRVAKVSSRFTRIASPAVNDFNADGVVTAVLDDGTKKYLVSQTYSGWGVPNNAARSYEYDSKKADTINPSKRSREAERVRVDGTFQFLDGPLEGVSLHPVRCN